MNDVKKLCATCEHEHSWGIVGKSEDNVPLYGAKKCRADHKITVGERVSGKPFRKRCNCKKFVEAAGGSSLVALALPPEETKALWQATSFLNAQVPAATRIAVRQILTLKGAEREKEFMGLMISQITDIRSSLTKDENKFAHLVAHTDEIVDSMKNVTQLSDALGGVDRRIESNGERMDRLEVMLNAIMDKLGIEVAKPEHPDPESVEDLSEAARNVFTRANFHIQDEPIVADSTLVDE